MEELHPNTSTPDIANGVGDSSTTTQPTDLRTKGLSQDANIITHSRDETAKDDYDETTADQDDDDDDAMMRWTFKSWKK
jgi:hypothetical protein